MSKARKNRAELEIEMRHLATKEELQKLGTDFHREMMINTPVADRYHDNPANPNRLIEHGTQSLPEAMVVVNPAWRPDPVAQILTVELHRLGSPLQDAAVEHLCQLLTYSETLFPTTNLRLIFRLIGSN